MALKLLMRQRIISGLTRYRSSMCGTFDSVSREYSSVNSRGSLFTIRNERNNLDDNRDSKVVFAFSRFIHSTRQARMSESGGDVNSEYEEEDDTINDFLSRFVAIMRGKIMEVYTDCEKSVVDGMLLAIVQKVVSEMEKGGLEHMVGVPPGDSLSSEFSEDLWRTVWEVSNKVLEDMEKERKKEKMKTFLQCEEVTKMCRFAGEIGIRGDMLRQLRFKWACEKMEETEFYEKLEKLKEDSLSEAKEDASETIVDTIIQQNDLVEDTNPKVVTLPKRQGKIRYKIYGLDLSDAKWNKVADSLHESEEVAWATEPKQLSGQLKLITEKIVQLMEGDDPSPVLAKWAELLEPKKVDWINLLNTLKFQNTAAYFKVAELLLDESTFHSTLHDYCSLIDGYTKVSRMEDAERILKKMTDKGIMPDMLTTTILIGMYSNAGNLERAKDAFKSLRSHGFMPDTNVYNSMIMAYVKAGEPREGELLIREMEARDMKPTREMYMALLQSFSQLADVGGANQIANTMQFAGFELDSECYTLLIVAYGAGGDPEKARSQFDYMMKLGHKPNDRAIASVVRAYKEMNLLDQALSFLLQLETNGYEPGSITYTVLVDWMAEMGLIEEAEQLLSKLAHQGEVPPFHIQVILCPMYARAQSEKKTLQALGILEANEDQLSSADFEKIINGLLDGGFTLQANRLLRTMKRRGLSVSESLSISLSLPKFSGHRKPKIL